MLFSESCRGVNDVLFSVCVFQYTFDENMLPSCMFNPDFRVFGLRVYLRNKDSMICPIHTPIPASKTTTSTTTTRRPWRPQTRKPKVPATFTTLQPPSYDDTIILDDIIRERENSASSTRMKTTFVHVCGVVLTLVGLHALLMRCLVEGAVANRR